MHPMANFRVLTCLRAPAVAGTIFISHSNQLQIIFRPSAKLFLMKSRVPTRPTSNENETLIQCQVYLRARCTSLSPIGAARIRACVCRAMDIHTPASCGRYHISAQSVVVVVHHLLPSVTMHTRAVHAHSPPVFYLYSPPAGRCWARTHIVCARGCIKHCMLMNDHLAGRWFAHRSGWLCGT
jgi:hypothetical protein